MRPIFILTIETMCRTQPDFANGRDEPAEFQRDTASNPWYMVPANGRAQGCISFALPDCVFYQTSSPARNGRTADLGLSNFRALQ